MVRRIIKKLIVKVSLILFTGLLCQSCYYDNEQELYPSGFSNCDTTEVTYSGTIQPLIISNCALSGCHAGNSGLINLTSYDNLRTVAEDGRLEERVVINESMPPSGPLPSCEQQAISEWIEAGALNN